MRHQAHCNYSDTFECVECKREVCWCMGAWDDMPDVCDDCWCEAHTVFVSNNPDE